MTESEFNSEAQDFLAKVFLDLEHHQINLAPHWDIDHVCFRVDTEKSYETYKKSFSAFGELLIESMVGGRLIATYKLHRAIEFKRWKINLVELPAPKPGKPTPTGFEHIEVVCDVSFDDLKEKYRHLKMDLKGLSKEINPELELVLGVRNIKFHHSSLASVIELEKSQRSE